MVIEIYLLRKRGNVFSTATFDTETGETIVKKGSRVSVAINHSETFNRSNSIERKRLETVTNQITNQDVRFSSPSTAANFVTGNSSNGWIAWKTKDGKTLKKAMNDS